MTDLYEHQAKALFAAEGIPLPSGELVRTRAEAERAALRLGYPLVVKRRARQGRRGAAR